MVVSPCPLHWPTMTQICSCVGCPLMPTIHLSASHHFVFVLLFAYVFRLDRPIFVRWSAPPFRFVYSLEMQNCRNRSVCYSLLLFIYLRFCITYDRSLSLPSLNFLTLFRSSPLLARLNLISSLYHWRALFSGAPRFSFVTYFVT